MCIVKIGRIIKIQGREAIVKIGNKTSKINISLLKNIKPKDKIICSGKLGIEKVENED